MKDIYQGKKYNKDVMEHIYRSIKLNTELKTKKEIKLALINALAYNTVVSEIVERVQWILVENNGKLPDPVEVK